MSSCSVKYEYKNIAISFGYSQIEWILLIRGLKPVSIECISYFFQGFQHIHIIFNLQENRMIFKVKRQLLLWNSCLFIFF
ncbi:hypothetical protein OK18_01275 [Chryseobacterium gallinarum]|uniref:Uncharacterized protein n=1 Tax=Chryseobacterium gallinarum TaxID=1324352 RepID=A0A0G3M331_CHRGL|nr:hypothetical protein OK18_01275 [Chryseobacterium gallinarum]